MYGTHIELDVEWNGNKNNGKKKHNQISVVYAIPSRSSPEGNLSIRGPAINTNANANANTTSSSLQSRWQLVQQTTTTTTTQSQSRTTQTRGIVVLLHACTHNALKFFSPSPDKCPSCVGLSEELRLARIVLERGYVALAVTAGGGGGGCWRGAADSVRIRRAVHEFLRMHQSTASAPVTVYAIGASSGGTMAAALVADKIAQSAAVMVMGLRDPLLDRLLATGAETGADTNADADTTTTTTTTPLRNKLYLAPMTRDKGTAQRARKNYQYVTEKQHVLTTDKNGNGKNLEIVLDETSCVPLPVTPNYLWSRVPGMTLEAAGIVVDVLVHRGHLDAGTHLLLIDPTKSNWRDYLLVQTPQPQPPRGAAVSADAGKNNERLPPPVPASLMLLQQQNKNDIDNDAVRQPPPPSSPMLLWGTFDLTPGLSPLAKALHRAWAFHEYCSEAVGPALDFFEDDQQNHHQYIR